MLHYNKYGRFQQSQKQFQGCMSIDSHQCASHASHRDYSTVNKSANIDCQCIACSRSFDQGLTLAKVRKVECLNK